MIHSWLPHFLQKVTQPQTSSPNRVTPLTLRAGQMVQGEVLRLLPDQTAVLKVDGKATIQAKLEVPLTAGRASWFQVQSTDTQPVQLKLIPSTPTSYPSTNVQDLMQYFQLGRGKQAEQLLQYLITEHVPLSKRGLQQALPLIQSQPSQQALTTIKTLMLKKVPLTQETFQAVRTFLFGPSLMDQLIGLNRQLSTEQQLPLPPRSMNPTQFFQWLGLDNESQLRKQILTAGVNASQGVLDQTSQPPHVKQLLFHLMQDTNMSAQVKASATQMMSYITGQQLLLTHEQQQGYQFLFQLPFMLSEQPIPVYGQLEGQTQADGHVNPDHCRLVFYLNLPTLQDICLDINIQAKVVSVSIFHPTLPSEVGQSWLDRHQKNMYEALKQEGYHLSQLKWEQKEAQTTEKSYQTYKQLTQGVDIRL
ncbi:hypothetical protein [Caldalkalibacillus salinus]|uniref:hypothetical protein n=1 Tax=Caldalkalibacillus salinus TaxID=2803787 RepID=UPI0019237887|nr:hypothetical protein [Caldalkalibacillus salinus]